MKIKSLYLQNFKRFTDLTIDLDNEPKLVLLVGTNGCGKSGVFDAFEYLNKYISTNIVDENDDYYKKNKINDCLVKVECFGVPLLLPYVNIMRRNDGSGFAGASDFGSLSFYGRSAIRYLPRITRTTLGETINVVLNPDKPQYYIDVDVRFENDIDILAKRVLDQVLKAIGDFSKVKDLHITQFKEITTFLDKVNGAFLRVLGENPATSLKFIGPLTPADGEPTKLMFAKGESHNISYDLLSSGEKEVANILLNLFVRTPFYQDTIYYFDELDAHLHTSLQYNLLKEITENWIPNNCQVWVATHSLGFIQYAKSLADAAIIDFDNLNFDEPQTLSHQQTSEIFDIAVPKEALPILFKDKRLVFCENQNAALFNSLGLADTLFLGDIDKSTIVLRAEQESTIYGLIDRDYLSDNERIILQNKFQKLSILDYYCFENYAYHPDNLKELYPDFDTETYKKSITAEKNKLKNRIIQKLDNNRNSYIFYKKEFLKNNVSEYDTVVKMLESDDFEVFYKVFSMKGQGGVCKIHNLNTEKLVATEWFKDRIKAIIEN